MIEKDGIIRLALWIIVVAISTMIFSFSSQPANISQQTSDVITNAVVAQIENNSIVHEAHVTVYGRWNARIRDLAHSLEFAVLAVAAGLLVASYIPKYWALLSFTFCCVFAGLDELHQLFVPGRGASIQDWWHDIQGCIAGTVVLALVLWICQLIHRYRSAKN